MAKGVPTFQLNNSTSIPALGLGTVAVTESLETVQAAIFKSLQIGYRHLDTASLYQTEVAIGNALQEAFATGLVKREDVFITTKIGPSQLHIDKVVATLKESLSQLQLDYVDLYLVHWPLRLKEGTNFFNPTEDDFLPLDLKGTWEVMEKLVELGLTKSIGVSNFSVKRLHELLAHANIVPAVNQVELHPHWQQAKLRAYCRKKGIHVSAWSPIGAPGLFYGATTVINNPILKQIAEKHGKSVAQISLRWIYEQGASALPKSFNEGRQKENISIWDFSLTNEDYEAIKTIEQSKVFKGERLFFVPWGRTFQEFWDDDE